MTQKIAIRPEGISRQQVKQKSRHARQRSASRIDLNIRHGGLTHRTVETGQPAVQFQIFDLAQAGFIQSASTDEFDDSAKFIPVKPCAMLAADIHNHCGVTGEVDAIHDFRADRAVEVANLVLDYDALVGNRRGGQAEDGRLFFLVSANLAQCFRIQPNAFAMRALLNVTGSNLARFEVRLTARAGAGEVRLGGVFAVRLRSAMRAKFLADEHHPETGGAGHSGETRAAMFASRGIRRRSGAAHGAVQGLGFHIEWEFCQGA